MAGSNAGAGTVSGYYDWSNTPPSIAVVDAIAALENAEPGDLATTLDTTLFDHVDPEALDTLVGADGRVAVSFPFGEYHVRIDGNELAIGYD